MIHIVMVLWYAGQEFVHHSTHTNPEFATQAAAHLLEHGFGDDGDNPRFPESVRIDRKFDQRQPRRTFNEHGKNSEGVYIGVFVKEENDF